MASTIRQPAFVNEGTPPPSSADDSGVFSMFNSPVCEGAESSPVRRVRAERSSRRPLLRTSLHKLTEMATIIVGDAENSAIGRQATYTVHKDLLIAASPFFAAALDENCFTEAQTSTVKLPETKPDIFEWFLQWLYTGTLTTAPASTDPILSPSHTLLDSWLAPTEAQLDGDLRNSASQPKYFLLLEIWALADQLLATPLANLCLTTIARLSDTTNSVPTPSDTAMVFRAASEVITASSGSPGAAPLIRADSPLRALILDLFVYKRTDRLLSTHAEPWHPAFLLALAVRLKRPDRDSVTRHRLAAWTPTAATPVASCEACRIVLRVGGGMPAERCQAPGCEKTFCAECLLRLTADQELPWHGEDVTGCRPWSGNGICRRYHEHSHGEACA